MVDFAKYAFNKSHAAAYSVLAMQTAYLKYYYPVEYAAALFSSVIDNNAKLGVYLQTLKAEGINILPPSINKSNAEFSVEDGSVRFGLAAINGIGFSVAKAIEEDRKKFGDFKNFDEIVDRLKVIGANSKAMMNLADTGAFSEFGGFRKQYSSFVEKNYANLGKTSKKEVAGQMDLFSMFGEENEIKKYVLPQCKEYNLDELYTKEFEATGLYISGHPLDEYKDIIKERTLSVTSADFIREDSGDDSEDDMGISSLCDGEEVTVAGIVTQKRISFTKKDNKQMAFITLEDQLGKINVVVFPNQFLEFKELIEKGQKVFITGNVSVEEERITLLARTIEKIEIPLKKLWIRFPSLQEYKEDEKFINNIVSTNQKENCAYVVMIYCNKEKSTKKQGFLKEEQLFILKNRYEEKNCKITK